MSTFEHAKLQIDREFCFKTEPVEFTGFCIMEYLRWLKKLSEYFFFENWFLLVLIEKANSTSFLLSVLLVFLSNRLKLRSKKKQNVINNKN